MTKKKFFFGEPLPPKVKAGKRFGKKNKKEYLSKKKWRRDKTLLTLVSMT